MLLAGQCGAVSRAQMTNLSFTKGEIEYRLRSGELLRARPQVFVAGNYPPSWNRDVTVAWLWAGTDAVVSHRTAGLLFQMEGVLGRVFEITVPRARTRRADDILIYRRDDLVGHDVMKRSHLKITSPTRTLIDLGAVLDEAHLELALEDALRRRLTTVERLNRRVDRLCKKGKPGCAAIKSLLAERGNETPTESGLETRVANALRTGRLPRPCRQFVITSTQRFIARVDFAYPEAKLAIEAHSYKHHEGRQAWLRDMDRDRTLRRLGWEVIYVTDEDLRERKVEMLQLIRDLLQARAPQLMMGF